MLAPYPASRLLHRRLWRNWRATVGVAAVAVVIAGTCSCRGAPTDQPAVASSPPKLILVITVDSLRRDTLGAYGDPTPVSPAFDRLAEQSHVFEHAYAPSSWTKPSMASMLTGTIVSRHLVYFSTLVRKRVIEYLSGAFDGDFERLYLRGTALPQRLPLFHAYLEDYRKAAFIENTHLRPELGFDRGWDDFVNFEPRKSEPGIPGNADAVNRRILDDVGRHGDRPIAIWAHYFDVHWPYGPIDDYGRLFLGGALEELPQPLTHDGLEAMVAGYATGEERVASVLLPGLYRAGIRAFDDRLGELLEALRSRGLFDDALIIVTSDHGDELFEHGSFGHAKNLYDTVIAIPLLIKLPGQQLGQRHQAIVSLIDIGPTVLDAAGRLPEGVFEGASLLPVMAGDPGVGRHAVSELVNLRLDNMKAIMTDEHKLIRELGNGDLRDRLFPLESDFEALPLDDHRATVDAMIDRLHTDVQEWDPRVLVGKDVAEHGVDRRQIDNLDEIIEQLKALGYF